MVANNDLVTACDMSKLPLENESVDIVVFCLSLMGTNLVEFVREAHRILKMGYVFEMQLFFKLKKFQWDGIHCRSLEQVQKFKEVFISFTITWFQDCRSKVIK